MKTKIICIGWAMFLAAIQICLNGPEAAVAMAAAVEDPDWQLIELNGIPVSPLDGERKPFLKFDAVKKQATGFAGCNNFFSGYQRDGVSLKFGPVASTRMFCPDLQLSLETEFFKALEQTREWQLQDNILLLLDCGSNILARFTDNNIQGVIGTVWQWRQTLYNDDRKIEPKDSNNYTLQLREDGTINVKADCNMKGGRYSLEKKHLSLEITHSTMAACPEDSMEDEFVRELSGAAVCFIEDGDFFLDLKYDSGTMRFSKQN